MGDRPLAIKGEQVPDRPVPRLVDATHGAFGAPSPWPYGHHVVAAIENEPERRRSFGVAVLDL